MNVRVLLFAALTEQGGTSELELTLPDNATAGDVKTHLKQKFASMEPLLDSCAIAVNQSYVKPDHKLREGDDVAIIPPVSGG